MDIFRTDSFGVDSGGKDTKDPGVFVRRDVKSHSVMTPKFNFDMAAFNAKYNQDFNNPSCGSIFLSKTPDVGVKYGYCPLDCSSNGFVPSYSHPLFDDSGNMAMGNSLLMTHYKSEELRPPEANFKLSDYQGRLYELSKSPTGSQ